MLRAILSGLRECIGTGFARSNRTNADAEPGVEGDGVGEHANAEASHSTEIDKLVARDRISKREIRMATGLQPNEFLVEVVHHNGGQMWQGELADALGWSSSTMSRSLNELESAGEIERRQLGRRKRVFLPEFKPDSLSDSRFERTDSPESGSETTPPRDRESA